METRELRVGTKESNVLHDKGVSDLSSRQFNDFFTKMKQNKVELLARPGIEEDKDDDEPVEPLLLHRFPDPETALLLVDPEIRVFLEPLGAFKPGGFLFLEQLCKAQKAER